MTLPRPIGRNERVDPKPEELGLRSKRTESSCKWHKVPGNGAHNGNDRTPGRAKQRSECAAWNATQVGSSLEYLRLRPFPEGKQAEDGHFLWIALFVHSGRPQALLHPLWGFNHIDETSSTVSSEASIHSSQACLWSGWASASFSSATAACLWKPRTTSKVLWSPIYVDKRLQVQNEWRLDCWIFPSKQINMVTNNLCS